MLKNKKIKSLFVCVVLVSIWVGVSLVAQSPILVSPTSTNSWQPKQPNKNAKEGSWTVVDTGAIKIKKVSVGDTNEVWGVGEDGNIYQLTYKGWESRIAGVDVGAAEDGTVIVVNDKNEVLKRNKNGTWDTLPDIKLSNIAVGSEDAMWGTYQGQVFNFDDGVWKQVKNMSGDNTKNLSGFSVNAEEIVYAIDDKNNIYHCDLDHIDLVKEHVKKTSKKHADSVKAHGKKTTKVHGKVGPSTEKTHVRRERMNLGKVIAPLHKERVERLENRASQVMRRKDAVERKPAVNKDKSKGLSKDISKDAQVTE